MKHTRTFPRRWPFEPPRDRLLIVARAQNGLIGVNQGKLPWRIPARPATLQAADAWANQ